MMSAKKVVTVLGLLALASCSKNSRNCENNVSPDAKGNTFSASARINNYSGGNVSSVTYCGEPDTTLLLAGQNINAGYVITGNDENNSYVTYVTTGGWTLDELHLFYGVADPVDSVFIPFRTIDGPAGIPVNNAGNPVLGQFPVSVDFGSNITSHTVTIPVYVSYRYKMPFAAHAVVKNGGQNETAWGQGEAINVGGNWGMYFYCESTLCN